MTNYLGPLIRFGTRKHLAPINYDDLNAYTASRTGPAGHTAHVVRPEPPYARSPRGALNHRVRYILDERSPYYDYCVSWVTWCGQTLYQTPDKNGVQVVDPDDWVCHRCDDRAYLVGGLGWSGLLPQSGCEASGGAYFRPARLTRD